MITILTTGSRGDVQPYLALGNELRKTGYRVRVAAFENYETLVKEQGLEYYPVKGDVTAAASSLDGQAAKKADNPLKFILSLNKLKKLVNDLQSDFYEACIDSEAIIYHPGAPIGYFAAQRLKIPSILATPFPMTPTRERPSLIFYNSPRLGGTVNLLTHKVLEQVMWFASGSAIKQFWMSKFKEAPPEYRCPFPRQTSAQQSTIISCSNHIFPKPGDWPEHVNNTGYWFLGDAGDKPSEELVSFLGQGEAPVYVGFGSMGDPKQATETTKLVAEALRLCGRRGILQTGWGGLSKSVSLNPDILIVESAPHAWLFPRVAAVVHHGGAGTTHTGLGAGVPNVVVPSGNDQFAWGRRVFELGVGPEPIPGSRLSSRRLADAIYYASREDVQLNARRLGLLIQSEDGPKTATRIVMSCIDASLASVI